MEQTRQSRLKLIDQYWRTANFLGATQLYLHDNPLLERELHPRDIKPRILGHWGTQPGLNLIYAHLNRLIIDTDASILLVVGPGHGAPAILANLYLEGTLAEYYPELTFDRRGLIRLDRRFSAAGGVPSHLAPGTPGAIHEGGELGYALSHSFGAAFDNPDLIVACIVGDGESETGPMAASWHSNKFLDPATSGAVLPILHLNGVKLSGPTVYGRMSDEELEQYFAGCGYAVRIVDGADAEPVHSRMCDALDWAYSAIRRVQNDARRDGRAITPRWPMIILKTPKGWTGPKTLGNQRIEGTFHSHSIPLPDPAGDPEQLRILRDWLQSYRPRELFDSNGAPAAPLSALVPRHERRMGRNPHANGGNLAIPLELPDVQAHAVDVRAPGERAAEGTRKLGAYIRDVFRMNAEKRNFRFFCPDETTSNKMEAVFEETERAFLWPIEGLDEFVSRGGRVMEILSEHCCEGWLEGYLLTGRHGMFGCYEAFMPIVDSMLNQFAKWLKVSRETPWRRPIPSLNYLLTSNVWEQDHNGYSHQVPSFIDNVANKKGSVSRIYLPPDANCLLCVTDHVLRSREYVNLIVASKRSMPQWLSIEDARAHCARGASIWRWAGNDGGDPDVVLAAAGDMPTQETVAAAQLLRQELPELRVRVVNVVDLFSLAAHTDHPHGLEPGSFAEVFTADKPVIFSFHGYPRVIHELIYHRPDPARFHVHGYREEGTTTTPFDMLVLNQMSRYHLAIAALERVTRLRSWAGGVIDRFHERLAAHRSYITEHNLDLPEIRNWKWDFGRRKLLVSAASSGY